MWRRSTPALLALALAAVLGHAQEEGKKEAAPPNEMEARFHDGTTVRKVILSGNIELETKFGKLSIPVSEIRRIEFGFHLPDEVARKLDGALRDLVSDQFELREAANKDLLALGRFAYPALLKLTKNNDLETTRRAEILVKTLRSRLPSYQLQLREEDVVHVGISTIAGRITSSFKGQTEHFGEVHFKIGHLRDLRALTGSGEATVAVDPAKYDLTKSQWMDTEFLVNADNDLLITATGKIDWTPKDKGKLVSDPDGDARNGVQTKYGSFPEGALIGRIGENGQPFVVGKNCLRKASPEGKLFLAIVSFPEFKEGNQPAGTYEVKITSARN